MRSVNVVVSVVSRGRRRSKISAPSLLKTFYIKLLMPDVFTVFLNKDDDDDDDDGRS